MGFELTVDGDRLRLTGGATIYEATELSRALLAHGGNIELDLSGLAELDGAGFQVLVALDKELAARGHRLAVRDPSEAARAVFAALGADRFWAPLTRKAP